MMARVRGRFFFPFFLFFLLSVLYGFSTFCNEKSAFGGTYGVDFL